MRHKTTFNYEEFLIRFKKIIKDLHELDLDQLAQIMQAEKTERSPKIKEKAQKTLPLFAEILPTSSDSLGDTWLENYLYLVHKNWSLGSIVFRGNTYLPEILLYGGYKIRIELEIQADTAAAPAPWMFNQPTYKVCWVTNPKDEKFIPNAFKKYAVTAVGKTYFPAVPREILHAYLYPKAIKFKEFM